MAIILANDGIDLSAKEQLEALGHEVDTNKYEGDDLLKRLAEVDCVIVRSATKIRKEQLDAGKAGNLKLVFVLVLVLITLMLSMQKRLVLM